jgi:hypothetical protein
MAAVSPFPRSLLRMLSLFQILMCISSCFHLWPFKPSIQKIHEKLAFQKGDFSATFLPMFKGPTSLQWVFINQPPLTPLNHKPAPLTPVKILSTKTTCPLRLLDFLSCLCSSPDQRLNPDRNCGYWKVPYQLTSWLFCWKGTLVADKLTFQLKRYVSSWQPDFSAEKVSYQLTNLLFS